MRAKPRWTGDADFGRSWQAVIHDAQTASSGRRSARRDGILGRKLDQCGR
jgi:hypothetical protein